MKSSARRKKKLRVVMLCHEELVPPDTIEDKSDEEISDYRTEFDVLSTLKDLGHDAVALGLGDDIDALRRTLADFRPDVCFNLMVEFHGAANYDQHVVSYLELMRTHYTGCNPMGLTLARDKGMTKKILLWDGIPAPHFGVFERGKKVKRPSSLEYPLFVKSLNEEASLGISKDSIVNSDEELAARVEYIHANVRTDAIAEDYIEGREFYIGVIGNDRLQTFPVWELKIPNLAEGEPNIATRKVKWDIAYQKKLGVKNGPADLPPKIARRMAKAAKDAYRALRLSGYARLDIRMKDDGRFYILEANPNPDITFGEDFADSAEAAGIPYEELIERILRLGLAYEAEWKTG